MIHALGASANIGVATPAIEEAFAVGLRAVVSGTGAPLSRLFDLARRQLSWQLFGLLVGFFGAWDLEFFVLMSNLVNLLLLFDCALIGELAIQASIPGSSRAKATCELALQK